jgi:hypothetical protein
MTARRERRRTTRGARDWPVEINNNSGRRWTGRSIDLSTLGMRLRVDSPPIEVRGQMYVSFDPQDGVGPFWTACSIVRTIGKGEYGIRFLDLPPKAIERLKRLLDAAPSSAHGEPSGSG